MMLSVLHACFEIGNVSTAEVNFVATEEEFFLGNLFNDC